jgi:phosphatidylglycerol:prolipoprotein diacylglycerol transferase
MQQVLFTIPYLNIPVFGYGFMLFCAFVGCTWLAARMARREGIPPQPVQDLSVWFFVFGLFGARLTYIARYWENFTSFWQYFAVWDGGLIFYGSIPGAALGYWLAYHFQLRKHDVSTWKMLDVIAPCVALGLCLGRIGCLLNGCCYGNVACGSCPEISFPLSSPPRYEMVRRGHQTPGGFLTSPAREVRAVEPGSAAAASGLTPGDIIEQVYVKGQPIQEPLDLTDAFTRKWPLGERWLELDVHTADGVSKHIGPFAPLTIGLHPTQIYESISMALLLFFLLSYYPYKKRDGSLMVLFMFGYGVHRFLNEMLRTDTEVVAFGLTFSQNISVGVLIGAIVLALFLPRRDPPPLAGYRWLRALPPLSRKRRLARPPRPAQSVTHRDAQVVEQHVSHGPVAIRQMELDELRPGGVQHQEEHQRRPPAQRHAQPTGERGEDGVSRDMDGLGDERSAGQQHFLERELLRHWGDERDGPRGGERNPKEPTFHVRTSCSGLKDLRGCRRGAWLGASRRHDGFGLRVHLELFAQEGAVDDLQKRLSAGLNDVRRDRPAAQDAAIVLGLDLRLALGVLVGGDAVDAVIAQLDIDAGDTLDGLEDGVDRAVAGAGLAVQ